MYPKVYILILNWNGWRDTVECLESVFRSNYPNYQVVVCDNASADDSIANVRHWAEGALLADVFWPNVPQGPAALPVPKAIPFFEMDRATAESECAVVTDARLVMIQTGANLGFAGGNNVGLRYIMQRNDFDYVWLLNNDTVMEPHALNRLVERMQSESVVGICGATLLYYHAPDVVQALGGGRHNQWSGLGKQLGNGQSATARVDAGAIEQQMSYVAGAAMLVSKHFLTTIGLMSEEYFLYFEELDWALRAAGQFKLGYVPDAVVYHKEGASIGSSSDTKKSSLVADFYLARNKLRFTRKFFPVALVTVYVVMVMQATRKLLRRDFRKARLIMGVVLGRTRL